MDISNQQSSWLTLLGVTKAPTIEPKASKIKRHGNCFIEDKYKETRQLKRDILAKLKKGMAGCNNIFKALLEEGKIPAKNGKLMTIKAFREHYRYSVRSNRIDVSQSPRGELQKSIVDLFDSGVSEQDIYRKHGFDRTHVYSTLIMCGRIKKRDRAYRIESGLVKIGRINDMLKKTGDVCAIAKETGATKKYVRQLKLARVRTIQFLNDGMPIDEICLTVGISRVHAEYIKRGIGAI